MTVAGSLKIGTLLLQAELLKEADLLDSVQVAKRMKLPLGRVLVGTGFISDDSLNAALAAQALIRDKVLSHEIAIQALKATKDRAIGFEEALRSFGLHSDTLEFTARLGQLLVDSGLITMTQRNEALQAALAAGLPIGRVLVLKRSMSNLSAYAALSAQIMIRAGSITRDQAIEALQKVKSQKCTFEKALKEAGWVKSKVANKVMLGELLIISDQISEIDFLTTLENSLSNDRPLGTVLIESGLITKDKLDRTLDAQKKVTEGKMTAGQAAQLLQQEDADASALVEAIPMAFADARTANQSKFGISELLVCGKVLTHRQAENAQLESVQTGLPLEQVLMARGLIDSGLLDSTNRCLSLYSVNTISAEEAILALTAWISKRDEHVDDVLARVAQRDLA